MGLFLTRCYHGHTVSNNLEKQAYNNASNKEMIFYNNDAAQNEKKIKERVKCQKLSCHKHIKNKWRLHSHLY